jgi:hypothetical protein
MEFIRGYRRTPETSLPGMFYERNRGLKEMIGDSQEFITVRLDGYALFQSTLMRSEVYLDRLAWRADKVHPLLDEAESHRQPPWRKRRRGSTWGGC